MDMFLTIHGHVHMKLTVKAVDAAKPKEKPYKLFDGYGMYLEVSPTGSKYWRMKLQQDGKDKRISLGVYPEVTLATARLKRDDVRKQKSEGINLSKNKRSLVPTLPSFEIIAREWHDKKKGKWSERHAGNVMRRLENYLFPIFGSLPIAEVDAPLILSELRKIEEKGLIETTHILHSYLGQIFRYAVVTMRAPRDPAADLRGAFEARQQEHFKSLAENELPTFLHTLESYKAMSMARLALEFTILTMVRTNESRFAVLKEFNLEKCEWRIPADRMKAKRPHIVPLSKQAITLLNYILSVKEEGEWLFHQPNNGTKPMSENAMLDVLERLDYKGRTTVHGFRSTASTILNENGFSPDAIERQLAHVEGNAVRAAYNHAEYLPERRQMMQWWADYLDQVRHGTRQ